MTLADANKIITEYIGWEGQPCLFGLDQLLIIWVKMKELPKWYFDKNQMANIYFYSCTEDTLVKSVNITEAAAISTALAIKNKFTNGEN